VSSCPDSLLGSFPVFVVGIKGVFFSIVIITKPVWREEIRTKLKRSVK